MGSELVRDLLSSAVVVTILTILSQLVLRLIDNRNIRRAKADEDAAKKASDKTDAEDRDADAYDRLQAALAEHLAWDFESIQLHIAERRMVNEERAAQGKPPIMFDPLRPPPSLRPPPRIITPE